MNINNAIDSWSESIKTNELSIEDRALALVLLFYQFKTLNITQSDLKKENIEHIISKLRKNVNNKLSALQDKLIKKEIQLVMESLLDKDKPEVKEVIKPVEDEKYDPDIDVLDEEGYLDE